MRAWHVNGQAAASAATFIGRDTGEVRAVLATARRSRRGRDLRAVRLRHVAKVPNSHRTRRRLRQRRGIRERDSRGARRQRIGPRTCRGRREQRSGRGRNACPLLGAWRSQPARCRRRRRRQQQCGTRIDSRSRRRGTDGRSLALGRARRTSQNREHQKHSLQRVMAHGFTVTVFVYVT